MKRSLAVSLSTAELRERAEALGLLLAQRRALDAERKAVSADFRGRIDELTERIEAAGEVQRSGRELVEVEVEERHEGDRVRVYRLDTGECIEDRARDRQATLPGVA